MIDISIILIFSVILLFFNMFIPIKEILLIVNGLIISSLSFYIALNIEDVYISKIFMVLTFISIIMIPILLIMIYLEKLRLK